MEKLPKKLPIEGGTKAGRGLWGVWLWAIGLEKIPTNVLAGPVGRFSVLGAEKIPGTVEMALVGMFSEGRGGRIGRLGSSLAGSGR